MPEINPNNMTPEQLNDHINGHPGGKGPATYCGHTTPYGPATGQEDSRAHETGRNLVCRLLLEKKKNQKENRVIYQ